MQLLHTNPMNSNTGGIFLITPQQKNLTHKIDFFKITYLMVTFSGIPFLAICGKFSVMCMGISCDTFFLKKGMLRQNVYKIKD